MIDEYLNVITSQHQDKPKFINIVSTLLTKVDDILTCINYINEVAFDIDQAVGVQLDILGLMLGVSRNLNFNPSDGLSTVMDDVTYRIALKAKIAVNHWDGTINSIYELWDILFPDVILIIKDNQDMTMTVFVLQMF